MNGLIQKQRITEADLFDLHKLVIDEQILDGYKPVGDWKKENNSTTVAIHNQFKTIEFSDFWKVPKLMERWMELLNSEIQTCRGPKEVLKSYAGLHISLVCIHPFWDGNGRIARLIANLACLEAGYPPIIIEKEKRYDYIMALTDYTLTHGVPSLNTPILYEDACFERFYSFCEQCWQSSLSLVEESHTLQRKRDQRLSKGSDFTP